MEKYGSPLLVATRFSRCSFFAPFHRFFFTEKYSLYRAKHIFGTVSRWLASRNATMPFGLLGFAISFFFFLRTNRVRSTWNCCFLFRTRYNFINIRFGSKGLKFLFFFDQDKIFVSSRGLKGLIFYFYFTEKRCKWIDNLSNEQSRKGGCIMSVPNN